MSQRFFALVDDRIVEKVLPDPKKEALPGIFWGRFDHLFTPAFWCCRASYVESMQIDLHYRLGSNLAEEVVACLLGGYGMPSELGVAAFDRVISRIRQDPLTPLSAVVLESILAEPFRVEGRTVRYRYPRQRARYVSLALERLSDEAPPEDDIALRDWLMTFSGIGPKTASWITRNQRNSDAVAILDIHVLRAGILAGVFPRSCSPQKHYRNLEDRFLAFAHGIGVRPSILDAVIWREMRGLSRFACAAMKPDFRN